MNNSKEASRENELKPHWMRDIVRFLPLKSQFVLTGNVWDLFVDPNKEAGAALVPLIDCLKHELANFGCTTFVRYDPIDGFSAEGEDVDQWLRALCDFSEPINGCYASTLEQAGKCIPTLIRQGNRRVCVIMDYASRLLARPDSVEGMDQKFFNAMLKLSLEAVPFAIGSSRLSIFNPVFWIANRENDLPPWLTVGNPRVRNNTIPLPDSATRKQIVQRIAKGLPEYETVQGKEREQYLNQFVDGTNGMICRDILAIKQLSQREDISFVKIADAVHRFKIGIVENPWAKLDPNKLANIKESIENRIKGQPKAVQKAVDIIKRAVTGLSGLQASKAGGRPRGVLFLAGPTGTGKTELAKTLTEQIFGDEQAYIRFDMSEFSAEQADQRLLGAPPGYIGYDAGGELTNAIRQRPFSIILFDEIEKAHPRILDKFLQLLDDGVMTSGRGERVYFSESIIVFTSNLGIYRKRQGENYEAIVTPNDSPDKVELEVRKEVERFFKQEIKRPELLNRIGENIVVFDFIRPEIAIQIYDKILDGICMKLKADRDLTLTFSESAKNNLQLKALHSLDHGGRGIGNQVEALFINPLSRKLFEIPGYGKGATIEVQGFEEENGVPAISIKVLNQEVS